MLNRFEKLCFQRERHASARIRRHHAFALAPVKLCFNLNLRHYTKAMGNRSSVLCDADETLGTYTPKPAIDDCHTLPQVLFTSRCVNVLSFERFDEEVVGWRTRNTTPLTHHYYTPNTPLIHP